MSGFFHLDPGYFLRHFLRSLANLFWHYDTSYHIHSVIQHWPIWVIGAGVGVSAILFYCLFAAISRNVVTSPTAGSSVPYLDMVLVLAVFCALATPTSSGVNHDNLVARHQVPHVSTGFPTRHLSVGIIPPDRISNSAGGARSRVRSQCRDRIVVCPGGGHWSRVQSPAFRTDDV